MVIGLDRVQGLPAHPLLLHIPIIMIPLLAVLSVAFVVKPAWRAWVGVFFPLVWIGMFLAILLVMDTGEKLRDELGGASPLIAKHAHLADQLRIVWVVFTVIVIALFVVDVMRRRAARDSAPAPAAWLRPAATVLSILVVAGAVGSTVWTVKVGHAGAKAVWDGVGVKN